MQTEKSALFFLEMDMATERIKSLQLRNHKATLHHKFSQYDRGLDHSVGHFRPPQTISARANKKKNPISTILSNSCELLYF
jgi:hypothetical protein